jgi:hypothetical protein
MKTFKVNEDEICFYLSEPDAIKKKL